jgi:alkyl hydroperoxide reductase subunit AhpF
MENMMHDKRKQLEIDCYLSQGCQSEKALRISIAAAVEREGKKAKVNVYRIYADEAMSRGLSGSPSIFINGKELQPLGTAGFS